MKQLTLEDALTISHALENSSPFEILEWAHASFGDKLGVMTALGYSGIVMMDHLIRISPYFEPYFIDTGFHFSETLELMKRLEEHWKIKFNVIKPLATQDELIEKVGSKPWNVNPDLCCHYMKIEPLLRVIHSKTAWLSGLRRDQSATRADIDIVEMDGRGTTKIYPLAKWTFKETWDYIQENNLPYNPLHDKNYPSIGCVHCTNPVAPGEHERSGRWNSMPKLECGIHPHKNKF